MLGNGFDLANGLPTTYRDFLEFCKYASYIYKDQDLNPLVYKKEYEKKYLNTWMFNDQLKQILIKQFYSKQFVGTILRTELDSLNELYDCIKNNTFYHYFQLFLKDNCLKAENWIDFESEIAHVIHELERLIQYKTGLFPNKSIVKILDLYDQFDEKEFTEQSDLNNRFSPPHTFSTKSRTVDQIELNEIYFFIDNLLSNLNRITRALEIYLSVFISRLSPKRVTDFEGTRFTHVLSFNYTRTFISHYSANLSDDYDICYVHGEAKKNRQLKHVTSF